MDYDDEARAFNFAAGLLLGAAIGAGVALLMAPDSGRKTRRRIRRVAGDFADTAQDRWGEVSDDVRTRVDDAVKVARRRLNT
jgi:gas vesicle protein